MRRVALVALVALAASAGAAASTRTSSHPRIWLDAPTLSTLRARAKARTPEWKALAAACATFSQGSVQFPDGNDYPDRGIGEGYQGSGYWEAVLDLGLCAQTAPANRGAYAKRVADVLDKMSDPAHEPDPLRDDGYGIRFFGTAMAIGLDWASGAVSSGVKAQVVAALHRWIGAYEHDGFEHEYPQGNYVAGYYDAKALAALATDDDGEWSDWLNRVHGSFVRPYYASNLAGGGWPEGWNYGPLAVMNMTWPVDAARTAKHVALTEGFRFPLDAAKFIVHFTWPNLHSLEDAGTQHDTENPSAADPALATAEAGMLARLHDPFAPYMQDYARRVRAANPALVGRPTWGRWVDFLYWNSKARRKSMTSLPRSYFAPGMGMAAMRSSWSPTAVWASYKGAPYVGNPDAGEEFYDEGSLTIVNGAKQFLVYAPSALMRDTPGTDDGSGYEDKIYDNIFGDTGTRDLFNVFMTSDPSPSGQTDRLRSDGASTATTFSDTGTYAVAQTRHLEDLYPRTGDATITGWSRDVVYVRPRLFVVHDHTTVTSPAPDQWLAWHFLGRPSRLADGRYRLSQGTAQTVLPAAHTDRIVDVFSGHKVFRLEVRPDAGTTHDWITVFWAGDGSKVAEPLSVPGGVGVQVGVVKVTFANGAVSVTPSP